MYPMSFSYGTKLAGLSSVKPASGEENWETYHLSFIELSRKQFYIDVDLLFKREFYYDYVIDAVLFISKEYHVYTYNY